MNLFCNATLGFLSAMALSACTTTQKVAVQQPSDFNMSCGQIEGEFAKLDAVMEDASEDKGVNTANVAAVVFFWPAAVGNYMNAADAEELVEKRRAHLIGLYQSKGCTTAAGAAPATAAAAPAAVAPASQSIEEIMSKATSQ